MISTSGSTGAGLKKCMPMTRSGCSVASAIFAIGIADVLEARIASGPTTRSSSANVSRFGSSSSTIASITRSQPARSSRSVVSVSRSSAASRSSAVSLPLLDGAPEVVLDRSPRALAELVGHLAPDRLEPGLRGDLGDPCAHRPQTDHSHPPNHERDANWKNPNLPRV